jgi:hypothetical protein
MSIRSRKVWTAVLAVVALVSAWKISAGFDGTEFAGARVTGPVLDACNVGLLLFTAALLLVSFRRISAVLLMAASISCIPFVFLGIAPGPFRSIVGGEWKTPLTSAYVWNPWAVMTALAISACVPFSIRNLVSALVPVTK